MGMDVHAATTVVCVLNAEGRQILETIVATQEAALIGLAQSLSGPLHITFEETTQAAWLYQVPGHMRPKWLYVTRDGTSCCLRDRRVTSRMQGNSQSF